jgi:hypothetical protein
MTKPAYKLILLLLFGLVMSCQPKIDKQAIRQEIVNNGETIRAAFATADTALIRSLHHPEVIKALGYTDIKNGREEVMTGLEETFQNFSLAFIENEIESILIQEDLAIEQSRFAIEGTPKNEGTPFVFRGRTMVTYVRYKESPTGWATVREIIQPATD